MKEVKVFTKSACPECEAVTKFLKNHEIDFSEIDIEGDNEAQVYVIDQSGQMEVPVTVIKHDGQKDVILGFNKQRIEQSLIK